jgi:hypothetical protein
MKESFEIDIKTVSEANSTQHWSTKHKRHKQQQFFVRAAYMQYMSYVKVPCNVTLTRLAPHDLDSDNLQMAFKWIRDEISELILPEHCKEFVDAKGNIRKLKGRADSDERITWDYKQTKRKKYGIIVEIEF